jgi:hypothetical protein
MAAGPPGSFASLAAIIVAGSQPPPFHYDRAGETTTPLDVHKIADDPGMVGFRDLFRLEHLKEEKSADRMGGRELMGTAKADAAFGRMLFQLLPNDYQPQPWPYQRGQGFNAPGWREFTEGPMFTRNNVTTFRYERLLPGEPPTPQPFPPYLADNMVVFWRTANTPSREPTDAELESNKELRAQVEEAWRLYRARATDRQKAVELSQNPELQKALKSTNDPEVLLQTLRDLAQKVGSQVIELKDDEAASRHEAVARQVVINKSAGATSERTYTEYKFPTTIPNVQDTGNNTFLEKLLTLSPTNRVKVVEDIPEKTYYVAVLLNQAPPSDEQVLEVYRDGSTRGGGLKKDKLLEDFVKQQQTKYREEVIKLLRARAGKVDKNGAFEIDKDFRKAVEGRGGEEGE